MRGAEAKQHLLARAIAHVAEHGLGDTSLRAMAAAIGTSHRMLIHHFGSKEGLWVEIVRTVEARQREVLTRVLAGSGERPREAMRAWWRHISDRSLWPNERLFFELYAQALQGRPHATDLLDGVVDAWVDPVAGMLMARGMPAAAATAYTRLGVAVTRGLLLDLLATGDVAGVDAAMEAFIDVSVGWLGRAALEPIHLATIDRIRSVPTSRPGVLFVCVHNAGRSQMAAALLAHAAGDRVTVRSAGSAPADEIDPAAVQVMAELGIDLTGASPGRLTDEHVQSADVVITMGCGDACPVYPGKRYEDWEVDDPRAKSVDEVRRIRDDVARRVETLIASFAAG